MYDAPGAPANGTLLRINEVAAESGLTARTICYHEELGLLAPAARSGGDYRLRDESDVERIRGRMAALDASRAGIDAEPPPVEAWRTSGERAAGPS